MASIDVISLTRELIAFNSINPPGRESAIAKYVGDLLFCNGFDVEYIPFEEDRYHVIAEKGCSKYDAPVIFSGHLDTVPLGEKAWETDPFGGKIESGRIYGRGSSDMKGGVAAMVVAAIESFYHGEPVGGVKLILTAGEELGCQGTLQLVSSVKDIGTAKGIIVGEPTENLPAIGHKGGLFFELEASGGAAHSSMPHLGDNAIYKIARAITKVENFDFGVPEDAVLGWPTMNVGKVSGGLNLNSVPDRASFTIDARTIPELNHGEFLEKLRNILGEEIQIKTLVDLPAVFTSEESEFVRKVYNTCTYFLGTERFPKSLPYLTDASVLQSVYRRVPIVILGPGQPEMAHRINEFCYTSNLEKAVEIYKRIII